MSYLFLTRGCLWGVAEPICSSHVEGTSAAGGWGRGREVSLERGTELPPVLPERGEREGQTSGTSSGQRRCGGVCSAEIKPLKIARLARRASHTILTLCDRHVGCAGPSHYPSIRKQTASNAAKWWGNVNISLCWKTPLKKHFFCWNVPLLTWLRESQTSYKPGQLLVLKIVSIGKMLSEYTWVGYTVVLYTVPLRVQWFFDACAAMWWATCVFYTMPVTAW